MNDLMQDQVGNTKWTYKDALGINRTGTLDRFSEGMGTDVTYYFRRDGDGKLDAVSGSRLKDMKKIK